MKKIDTKKIKIKHIFSNLKSNHKINMRNILIIMIKYIYININIKQYF